MQLCCIDLEIAFALRFRVLTPAFLCYFMQIGLSVSIKARRRFTGL